MGTCISCGRKTIEPIIRSKPYMIIKESPTNNELESGQGFVLSGKNKYGHSENTTSYYLMKELGMAGVNMQTLSLVNFYNHVLPKNKRTKEEKETLTQCQDYCLSETIKVAKDMKIILLMGADVVRLFTGYGVNDVMGLVCKSQYLSNVPIIIPAPNSDKIMSMPIGEMRNALAEFSRQIKIYEQYQRI